MFFYLSDVALAGRTAPRRGMRWSKMPGPYGAGSRELWQHDRQSARNRKRGMVHPDAAGASGLVRVGGETLAAAAFSGGIGIFEGECLAQALPAEVDLRAIHQRQAGGIDIDMDTVLFEHRVIVAPLPGQVGHVTPSRAAGAGHTKTPPQSSGSGGDPAPHA